jgi:hypothetical protein
MDFLDSRVGFFVDDTDRAEFSRQLSLGFQGTRAGELGERDYALRLNDILSLRGLEPGLEGNFGFFFAPSALEEAQSVLSQATRGRGGAGRQFVRPDPLLVEEAVKAALAAMVGQVDPVRVKQLTELFQEKARQDFSQRGQQVDPMSAVKEKIRTYSDYKALHQLRDETVDEMTWISSRQGALVNAGLPSSQAAALGRSAAQVDATATQTAGLAETAGLRRTGSAVPGLIQSMARTANAAFRLIR